MLRKYRRIYTRVVASNLEVKKANLQWILVKLVLEKQEEKEKRKWITIKNLAKPVVCQNWTRVIPQQLWSICAASRLK